MCRVSMMRLFLVSNWTFSLAMVANYFDYFVFRRSACSFDAWALGSGIAIRPAPVWFVPDSIRALWFGWWLFQWDPMDLNCRAFAWWWFSQPWAQLVLRTVLCWCHLSNMFHSLRIFPKENESVHRLVHFIVFLLDSHFFSTKKSLMIRVQFILPISSISYDSAWWFPVHSVE